MVQFSDEILNTNIAPGVSAFTTADILDMLSWAPESRFWIANYFLNTTYSAKFAPEMHAYAYNFLRRATYAFKEHEQARAKTAEFLALRPPSPSHYAMALFHWENFLGQCWHAYALLITAWSGRAFEKDDGSVEQRLNALYNQMKHVESRIESGQIIAGVTVPVWLENEGLCSIDTRMTYAETAEVLKDLAKYANALMNPKTAKDSLSALDALHLPSERS